MAEIHHFRMVDNEDQWGELAAMKLKMIRRLEMADTLQRIQEQDDGLIDDTLQSAVEGLQHGHRA